MDIVFLDIDGVLNVPFAYASGKKYNYLKSVYPDRGFYSNAVSNLNELMYISGASIVITSTWRHNLTIKELQNELTLRGVYGKVIGKTETLNLGRGEEISEWLDSQDSYYIRKYAIIDDNIQDIKKIFPLNYIETDKFKGFGVEELLNNALNMIL